MVRYEAAENFRIFIKSGGVGFILGAVHCLFSVVFGVRNKNAVVKTVGDILFFLAACTVTFVFLLGANNGFFRAFVALGEGAGFLVFLLLPENVTISFFRAAADRTEKAFLCTRKVLYLRSEKRKEKTAMRRDRKKIRKSHKKTNKTLACKHKDDI